jgi:transglutaminase-like putative cysteine protease
MSAGELPRIPTLLVLAAFGAGTALHADVLPPWCTAVAAAALLWRGLNLRGTVPLPGRALRAVLVALLLAAILGAFRTVGGLAAGSALLAVMGAAKLLETRTPRDAVVVATVALVLVLAAGLDRQGLPRLPAYLGTGWLALASIAALGSRAAAHSARRAFANAGQAMLLAVPLAVLCFVFVPRLPGALWSMPPSEETQTGLGDEMTPGSITELAVSDAIAFRVRFEGPPPPPGERYWRGPVLHQFDGATWRRAGGFAAAVRQQTEFLSPPLRYQVMLEPHGRQYLLALDTVEAIRGPRHLQTFDGQLLAFRPVTAPAVYQATSHLRIRQPGELSHNGRRLDLQLPAGRNPRSSALARQLRAQVDSDAAYTRRVLDYLRSGGFRYTLTPQELGQDSVDDLLFGTRLGFCGHYASAYVTLMRAAGVPARVVTGYLGGTWNAIGGYYALRQADAHAWAEVWLDGSGWTRIDPTAVVAPLRLRQTLSELLPEERTAARALFGSAEWLRNLRDGWDAADNWWQERVVKYDRAAQQGLLARLGLDRIDYGGLALLLAAGAALWGLLLFALLARRGPRAQRDALARTWERYARLLGRHGVPVAAHDGPEAIRLRARAALPEAAEAIDGFTAGYTRLRYGRGASPRQDVALRALGLRLRSIATATAARRRRRTAAAAPG